MSLQRAGKLNEASAAFAHLRRLAPKNFDAWHLGGNIALLQGKAAEATQLYTQALQINPRSAVALTCLGVARLAAGNLSAAETAQRQALRLEPKNAAIWGQLATVLNKTGRADEAISCHKQAIAFAPQSAAAWHDYGVTLSNLNRAAEALVCEERALAADPNYAPAHRGRAVALQKCHRIPEAVRAYETLLASTPSQLELQSHRLFALNYLEDVNPAELFSAHQAYGRLAKFPPATNFKNTLEPERKLRVAFFSADFREHSVAYFIEPLLPFLDRDRFEIVLYNFCTTPDSMTARFKSLASLWRDFPSHLTQVIEPVVRADMPDIVVDLGGHTGNSLMPLFARRVAPVQITYLGYPNTTGLSTMDYRLIDSITDPDGTADQFATEKLVRFAPTAWAYSAPAAAPAPATPPALRNGHVTFGSFNNFSKVTDSMLSIWSRLLKEVPDSRLQLKSVGLSDPRIVASVRERLHQAGLTEERVDLSGPTGTTADHLASYAKIDVALDTSPYNGTTTTCEALWMGVPVVTLSGDRHAARVGASLLHAAGHPEWIAENWDQYITIAKTMAADPAKLSLIRKKLREGMQTSILLDHPGQSARFGNALRACWQRWCVAQSGAK